MFTEIIAKMIEYFHRLNAVYIEICIKIAIQVSV